MTRRFPLLLLALAILAAAGVLAGAAWYGRAAARAARLETVRLRAREAVGEVARRFEGELEALVNRESARPFYLYQHYYSPPEALAAQFVLQTSPLAVAAEPLVSTYFEILPDGRIALPQEEPEGRPDRAGRELVAREVLPELIGRVRRAPPRLPLPTAVATNVATNVVPAPNALQPSETPAETEPPTRRPSTQRQQAPLRQPPEPVPPAVPEPPVEPGSTTQAPVVESPPQGQQVNPLPRWAVETNIRANDIARQIEVANTGDIYAQQQLQVDFNQLRGLPQNPVPQAGTATPDGRSAPDAGSAPPPPAGDGGADAGPTPAPGEADAAAKPAGDAAEPPDVRPDRPRTVRRRDAAARGADSGVASPADASTPDDASGGAESTAGASVTDGASPPTGPPALPSALASVAASQGEEEVPVVYGAFEPLRTPDGVTYYARTVDIEGDVRVQGFRLSPGGLRVALHDVLREVQRGHDAFRLATDAAGAALASASIDGVPEIASVRAVLRPDSPTLAAEDDEDRRIVLMLAGLSAVIAVAVVLAFLAVRREVELARRKSDFLSAVSHELRAPVTTIRMYAEMLRDGWVDDAVRRAEYETAIVSEGERLSRLVENVLAYSRRERGKPPMFRDADLAEKVREVVGLERPVFEKAKLTLEVEAPEALPWRFDADAVTQILVNLLDNALKHSRDATERRVTVRLEGAPGAATLSVEDHGAGIPQAEQRRIFEPFYRVGSELTRETRGAGLGLALVRRLAQSHEGDVSVRSEPGSGATFIVRLGRPG